MTDAEAKALPGADPGNEGHPTWAALQLARLLVTEDGFDRTKVACAFLAAAISIASDEAIEMPFAIILERAGIDLAREAALKAVPSAAMARA